MFDKSEDELLNDKELRALIDQLRPVPDRDPAAARKGRARYLSQVSTLLEPKTKPIYYRQKPSSSRSMNLKEQLTKMNPQKRFVLSAIALVMVIGVILFGGAGVTAYAAQTALPGDALYPIKTGLEQTQVKLSRDAGDQAQLHLAFAQRRLQEISSLISEGRFGEIDQAATEFEYHVQQAINSLQVVAAGDPVRANMLAGQIARTLTEFGKNLSAMMANVPDTLRPSMQRAIQTSQDGNRFPLDENSNFNLNGNTNGNTNENINENENGNFNLNENESNDNEDNFNLNENDNGEHDNVNLNSNNNGNTNMNENENDNSEEHNQNSNYNSNNNTNDDNEQENHNYNNNSNDNSHDGEGGNHNDNGGQNDNGGD